MPPIISSVRLQKKAEQKLVRYAACRAKARK